MFALFALAMLMFPTRMCAQVSTRISKVAPDNSASGRPILLTATLTRTDNIARTILVYRSFGESEYRRTEMDVRGNTATGTIPGAALMPPFLEYYIVFQLNDGSFETYPVSESANPIVNPPQRTARITVTSAVDAGVVFLSPESDLPIPPGDVLVSFSLLRADSTVDRKALRVFLDEADVTNGVVLSGDVGVLVPENLNITLTPGQHIVRVALTSTSGVPLGSASTSFLVSGAMFEYSLGAYRSPFSGSVSLESRNEALSSGNTWYNRGSFSVSGKWDDFKATASAFLTSDEKSALQPQDRFFVGVETPWAYAGYGDKSPSFPDLILSGMRVRGVHAGVQLGFFNLDVSSGQVNRPIDGTLLEVIADSLLSARQSAYPSSGYRQIDQNSWARFDPGTYQRELIAVRPSFGSGETWQLGFTWLHSKDDAGSILNGSKPQEDIVAGVDFLTRFDERRIELSAQGAFSAYNSDITGGDITDQRIASLFPNDTSTVKSVRDILSKFITVNENLRPLSLSRLSTAAGDATLQLRYFDNVFRFTYLYRGGDYNSFGQTFIRKDVQGFNINDRARLVDNSLLLTLGFEQLKDNTGNTKPATTTYRTYNIAATYVPHIDMPSFTVGYSRYDNSNGLDPDSVSSVSDATNRIYVQSSYDFTLGVPHTAALSVSSSDRTDATLRGLDVNTVSAGVSLTTRFNPLFNTGLDVTTNFNKLPPPTPGMARTRLDYTTVGLSARYEIIPTLFTLQAAAAPTFGDYKRTALSMSAEWAFLRTMRLTADYGYYLNSGFSNESYFSLRYRYDL
jgi:hypothetical protein